MAVGKGWAAAFVFVAMTWGVTGRVAAEIQYPDFLGPHYVSNADWQKLDAMVEELSATGGRSQDGRFQLYLIVEAIQGWFRYQGEGKDESLRAQIAEYDQQFPHSAFPPILAAMHAHATAWRARGSGFASTVTPEGWALFRERNATAWKLIQASKARSARISTWYERAIQIGRDANVPDEELMAIFQEGIELFPGYHPLHFAIARQFSPRWGGTYEDADAFITAQVVAKTNTEGEVLYARLYWLIDQYGGGDPDFFDESKVDWSRMRTGFDLLMKQFPNGTWNQANFTAFACRAGDGPTYVRLRPHVNLDKFIDAAPEGISLDVCDARFLQKT